MTREERLEAILAVLREQQSAVFAVAGENNSPPHRAVHCAVMFSESGTG